MADDIVLKVAVEGAGDAADELKQIGEAASSSFEETQKAADIAGVSIEEFGKLSEKTQQAYIELSQRVVAGSQGMVQATQEVQQAAAVGGKGTQDLGAGLDSVSEKSGVSSREMRALGKIMGQLGVGEAAGLALSFQKVASSLGILGVAALGFAIGGSAIVKFKKDSDETTKSLEQMSQATGSSVETLRSLENAFRLAGVQAKQFKDLTTGLAVGFAEIGPRIGDEIAASAEKATKALAALEKAKFDEGAKLNQLRLQSQQLDLQTQQLRLQGQQLNLNLASVRLQMQYLGQAQSIERQRADLTLEDAEANLKLLKLKRDLRDGTITQAQYDKEVALEEDRALRRAIEKAETDVANARMEKETLAQRQQAERLGLAMQAQQIQLAQEQLPIQQQALQLQREQNEMAKQQAERLRGIDVAEAARKAKDAQANMLGPLIDQIKRMAEGSQELINPLTNVETLLKAVKIAAGEAATSASNLAKGFNATAEIDTDKATQAIRKLFDVSSGLQKLRIDEVLKAWKLPDEVVTKLAEGTKVFEGFRTTSEAVQRSVSTVMKGIQDDARDKVTTPVTTAWKWIVETFNAAKEGVTTAANSTLQMITQFVTTAIPNAWQWLADSFNAVMKQIVDSFNAVINQIAAKIEELKRSLQSLGGGSSGAPAGGTEPRLAGGGLLGGRGSGTSDSNLAWFSRGEHLMPSGAVAQPGVLQFLEALRLSGGNLRAVLEGMGRFALGGPVLPRLPAMAGGGSFGPLGNFGTINLVMPDGSTVTGMTDARIAEGLRRIAVSSQVRSGGRKPSRY